MSNMKVLLKRRKDHWLAITGDNAYYINKSLTAKIRKQIFDTLLNQNAVALNGCINSLDFNVSDNRKPGDLALAIEMATQNQRGFSSLKELDQAKQIIATKYAFILQEYKNWLEWYLKDNDVNLSSVRTEISMLNSALTTHFGKAPIENIMRQNRDHALIDIYKQLCSKRDKLIQEYNNDINLLIASPNINAESILLAIRNLSSELAANKVLDQKDAQLEIILKSLSEKRDAMLKPLLDSADNIINNPNASGFEIAREISKLYIPLNRCHFNFLSISNILHSDIDPLGVRISQLLELPAYQELINIQKFTVPPKIFDIEPMNLSASFLKQEEQLKIIAFYTASACMTIEERDAFKNLYFYTTAGLAGADNFQDYLEKITSAIKDFVEKEIVKFAGKNQNANQNFLNDLLSDTKEHLSQSIRDLTTTDNRQAVLDCALSVELIKFIDNKISELSQAEDIKNSPRKIKPT